MTFRELGLSTLFADNLERVNIREPTPIQAEVFSPIVDGQSAVGLSKTGTGKTLAYLLPMIERLSRHPLEGETPALRGVVLVPTRELATQVSRDLDTVTSGGQKGVIVVGGESEDHQVRDAKLATWVIATPGRLLDLLQRRQLDVSRVQTVVFDEADRLLDMGFIDDIRSIMKLLPKAPQMLFFSATVHFGVDEMAYEFGAECVRFGRESDEVTVEGLDHRVSFVGDDEKFHALVWFIAEQKGARGMIFSNYRDRAHELCSRLRGLGCNADSLTAQLSQNARSKIMDAFREGKTRVLLGSDLAARGLDVFDVDFVVNFDLPEDPAIYVHRVGRTARAGRKGTALSFVGFEDSFRLEKLERFLGKPVERFQFPVEALQGRLHRFGEPQGPSYSDEGRPSREGGGSGHRGGRSSGGPRGGQRQGQHAGHQGPRQGHHGGGGSQHPRPQQGGGHAAQSHAPRAASAHPRTSSAAPGARAKPNAAPLGFFARVKKFFLGLAGGPVPAAKSEAKAPAAGSRSVGTAAGHTGGRSASSASATTASSRGRRRGGRGGGGGGRRR